MPLHFYAVQNGSKLSVVRPYVSVTIEDNHGSKLYKRLNKTDTIQNVKIKLSKACMEAPLPPANEDRTERDAALVKVPGGGIDYKSVVKHKSVDDMRLYSVSSDGKYIELDDDRTVKDCIRDGAKLYLLSYRWVKTDVKVTTKSGGRLHGVEREDTCLAVKVRAQDQIGVPVKEIKVYHNGYAPYDVFRVYNITESFPVELFVKTEEDLKAEAAEREETQRPRTAAIQRRHAEQRARRADSVGEHQAEQARITEGRNQD